LSIIPQNLEAGIIDAQSPVILEETQLFQLIEKTLRNVLALSLCRGPGGSFDSALELCFAFPGLFCLELHERLKEGGALSDLQGFWEWMKESIRKVTLHLAVDGPSLRITIDSIFLW
jgi:hypothetical protein